MNFFADSLLIFKICRFFSEKFAGTCQLSMSTFSILALFQFRPPANFSVKNRQILKIGKTGALGARGFLAMPIPNLISVFHSEAHLPFEKFASLVLVNHLWAHF